MRTWTNISSDSMPATLTISKRCVHHYIVDSEPTVYRIDSIGRRYHHYSGQCKRCSNIRSFSTRPWLAGKSPIDLISREDMEIAIATAELLASEHAEQVSSRIEELAYK